MHEQVGVVSIAHSPLDPAFKKSFECAIAVSRALKLRHYSRCGRYAHCVPNEHSGFELLTGRFRSKCVRTWAILQARQINTHGQHIPAARFLDLCEPRAAVCSLIRLPCLLYHLLEDAHNSLFLPCAFKQLTHTLLKSLYHHHTNLT